MNTMRRLQSQILQSHNATLVEFSMRDVRRFGSLLRNGKWKCSSQGVKRRTGSYCPSITVGSGLRLQQSLN